MPIIDPFMEQRQAAPNIVDPFATPAPTGIVDPFTTTETPWIDARTKPEAKPEEQSVFRQVADVPLQLQKGFVSGVRLLADAFGANTEVSQGLRSVESHIAGLMSAQSKQDSQEIARIMKDAEDKGILDQVAAGVKALSVAPVDTIVNALGTSGPAIVAGLVGGLPAAGAIGATMGAGTIKSAIFDAVNEELIKSGLSKQEAEARALKAQEYFGANTGMIATGAGLGAIESITGAQPAIAKLIAKNTTRKLAEDAADKAVKGYFGNAAKTAAKEAFPEFLQGAQEQLAQNLALQGEGFDVPTMRGVISQGTLEAGAGGGLGAVTGAVEVASDRRSAAREEQIIDQLQQRVEADLGTAAPTQEAPDVTQPAEPVPAAVEPSVELPSDGVPDATGGVEASLASGLAAAGELVGEPLAGAAVQPTALEIVSPPFDTVEEAQQALGTLPNPQAFMVTEVDDGFAVAVRPTEPAVSAAPATEAVDRQPPIVRYRAEAEKIEARLPPTPEGMTRLWRGNREGELGKNPQFTNDLAGIALPFRDAYKGPLSYVDVPTELVNSYVNTGVAAENAEFILPAEIAARAKEVTPTESSVGEAPEAVQAEEEKSQEPAPADTTVAKTEEAADALADAQVTATVNRTNPEAQKEQMRRNKALTTTVSKLLANVQKLSEPVTPEAMEAKGTPDERTIAVAEAANVVRQIQLNQAKQALFLLSKRKDLTQSNGKPWKARQMAIDAVANFTPEERAELEEVYAQRAAEEGVTVLKSTRIPISATSAPDNAFTTFTDAQQALRHIMQVGNAFEKLLASRLLNSVKGVKFVAVGMDTKIPGVVARALKDTTQGAYYKGVIYVHDTSFGDTQGINNTVVLHEALHAATTRKLAYAQELIESGENLDLPLQTFVTTMQRAMKRAETIYLKAREAKRTVPYLDNLYKNGAFTDINEFVSYGLTDRVMQSFLSNIPGEIPGKSLFTRFVEAVRKLFNISEQQQSAFQDLLITTDAVLSAKISPDANLLQTTPDELKAAKNNGKKAKKTFDDKLKQPLSAPEKSLTAIGELIGTRSWGDFKDTVSDIYNGTKDQLRRPMLAALTTRQILELQAAKEMTDADGKPLLDDVLRLAEDMSGAKMEMLDETARMAKEWHEWQKANPAKYRTLNRLIHLTTINQVDPSITPEKSATLTNMYESLGADGKALYGKIRDFYKARFLRYKQILVDRIASSGVDEETQAQLTAQLDKDFAKLPEPYFPLVREGKYWVRIGNPKSPSMEYYMFEDPRERNFFVRQRAKELGISLEELKGDPTQFAMGDNYMEAINEGMRSSKMLKEVVSAVDGATFSALNEEDAAKRKAELRDQIYQLYFSTLPEQNFRKHFLHRKGTAGFRADALRNFAKSSFHTSVQLAKIEYGDKIRKALARAWDATEGKPQREYLFKPVHDEIKDRINAVLSPEPSNAFATRLANTLGTASFVYYMSAPASAITNLTGLAIFGAPVLNGEFGPKANLALAKNMNIFKAVGVKDKEGKFTFPTLLSKLTGHRQQAFMEALRRGKIDTTLTYDTLQLARTPSDKYSGSTMTALNAIGYLFHHSEKINREVMFMSAYDLAYDRAKQSGRDDKTAYEEAVNEASRLTDEAMFDYSEFNKPRIFRGNLARVVFQFKSFAQQTSFYLIKNFKEMFAGADRATKTTAATKLIGTLGMTAMFAGSMGLPLVSVLVWAMSLASEDDEDPEKRNPRLRFRNWLREEFGENLGLALERGPVSWATDVDFHSRVKLDQLWFREIKQGKTEPEALTEFILNLMGPSVGLGLNVAEALRRINTGDVERGIEMLLPAGVRGFAAAMRMNAEGVRTLKDDKVVSRDELSAKEIAVAATGFAPTKVAAIQEDVSQARAELDKVNKERAQVLTMFKDLSNKFTPSRRDAAVRALKEFNKKNPMVALDADTIIDAIERNIEAGATAVRGIRTTEKLRPMLDKILPPDPYGRK